MDKQIIEGDFYVTLVMRGGMVEVESVVNESGKEETGHINVWLRDYDIEGVSIDGDEIKQDEDGKAYWHR